MKMLFHAGIAVAFCAGVTGCAGPGASDTSATATAMRAKAIPAASAKDAIIIGKSTRADVIAALGKTTVISFDSGFEVWVYQLTGDPAKATLSSTEFVVLFAPSGVVTKTRIRPAPAPTKSSR